MVSFFSYLLALLLFIDMFIFVSLLHLPGPLPALHLLRWRCTALSRQLITNLHRSLALLSGVVVRIAKGVYSKHVKIVGKNVF